MNIGSKKISNGRYEIEAEFEGEKGFLYFYPDGRLEMHEGASTSFWDGKEEWTCDRPDLVESFFKHARAFAS